MSLDYILVLVSGWLLIGVCGVLAIKQKKFIAHFLYPLGAMIGVALCAVGIWSAFGDVQTSICLLYTSPSPRD